MRWLPLIVCLVVSSGGLSELTQQLAALYGIELAP